MSGSARDMSQLISRVESFAATSGKRGTGAKPDDRTTGLLGSRSGPGRSFDHGPEVGDEPGRKSSRSASRNARSSGDSGSIGRSPSAPEPARRRASPARVARRVPKLFVEREATALGLALAAFLSSRPALADLTTFSGETAAEGGAAG